MKSGLLHRRNTNLTNSNNQFLLERLLALIVVSLSLFLVSSPSSAGLFVVSSFRIAPTVARTAAFRRRCGFDSNLKKGSCCRPFLSTTQIKMSSSSATTDNKDAEDKTANSNNPLEQFDGLPTHPILLGSASFTRKLILKEMGIPFTKFVRPIDEKALGDRSDDEPADLVLLIAKAKMDHLLSEIKSKPEELPSQEHKEWLVLTGDQVVTCNGQILEKPENIEEAKSFCAQYADHPPATVGSCVLTHLPSNIQVAGVDTATIYFKPTIGKANLIEQLVQLDEPILSCAGGLMIEHPLTKEHLDRIDGTEDSVMGLSKDLVLRLLEELSEKLKQSR